MLPGPVEAQVLRVIDGDTFVAEARVWPGQTITVSVRIRGVDAPELRSRCAREKAAGAKARAELEQMIGGATVRIYNVSGDKYFGRVLADVVTAEDDAVADHLLERALARPYSGGRRISFCG
ncbi:thermonuclease family protein [Chelativorans sp. Marseille-P2723]|uniref:thermonuclease family protein n=1 Tax=Chelativorans sp. Marseille-P2723 TaxID=2709133 RepID=UPI001FED7A4C|nr:thermonuclease family protein [Chelativorans sp. Marseille-P2723]